MKSKDIKIEYFRSTGPGGQRKNKKETAVRVTHIPTGIRAIATESRYQARNREIALRRLEERIARAKRKRKKRIPTKVPQEVKERMIREKKHRSEKKRLRRNPPLDY